MSQSGCPRKYLHLEAVVKECLSYLPEYVGPEMPHLRFGYAGSNFEDLGARIVADDQRAEVSGQLQHAYAWCTDRFPLSVKAYRTEEFSNSIREFIVGHCKHKNEILSASSAQAPGIVFMAAEWPMRTPYRFGSLIAHESIHQALFIRELEGSPVRPQSHGYSPWKNRLRAGRLVWHAFWTFTCQFVLLAESVLDQRALLQLDPTLSSFISDMKARISVCCYSLELSEIVSACELERCRKAHSISDDLFQQLVVIPTFDRDRSGADDAAAWEEFERWAKELLETNS